MTFLDRESEAPSPTPSAEVPIRRRTLAVEAGPVERGEERFHKMMEHASDVITLLDASGRITYSTQSLRPTLGYAFGEMQGHHAFELIHPEDRGTAERMLEEVMAGTGQTTRGALRLRHKEGPWRDLEVVAVNRLRDPAIEAVVVTYHDVTERKQAEIALRQSQERFRQIAESINEVFWLTSQGKDEVLYLNPAYEAIWGRDRQEVYASPLRWLEAIHPEDRDRVQGALEKQTAGDYDEEYRIVRPDGSIRWIRDRAFPVRNAEGEVIRVAGVAEDITERRDLEAQLRHSQKMEAVGLLASGVAHDFSNVLTAILGYGQLLLELLHDDETQRELVDEILRAGDQAAALTRRLLAFSRHQVLAPRVIDVSEVIGSLEWMLRRLIGEDVDLRVSLQPEIGRVRIDPTQVEQILINLAVNARDAMPRGGRLEIEANDVTGQRTDSGNPSDRLLRLSITDTGTGMTQEVKRRLFEPFFTTKDGRGTGLGLAVVDRIVEENGGRIEVDSEEGNGSTFKIYLPCVESQEPPEEVTDASPALPRGSETVLLVEDDERVRTLIKHALRRCDYEVLDAGHADDAVRICESHSGRIHLLVTDVVMPGEGGPLIAEKLTVSRPDLKVLYVSGYADDALARHGVLKEEVEFLQKPFSPADLARKVRAVLG